MRNMQAEMKRLRNKRSRKHSFEFQPVLTNGSVEVDWTGLGGLVTDHIKDLGLDLSSCQV